MSDNNKTPDELFREKQASMSDEDLLKLCHEQVSKLARTYGKSFKMSIPPSVNDIDVAFCELCRRYEQAIKPSFPAVITSVNISGKELDEDEIIQLFRNSRNGSQMVFVDDPTERFKMPTSEQLLDICVLFNDGVLNAEKLADMLSPLQFVLDRLFENGDVLIPSKKE